MGNLISGLHIESNINENKKRVSMGILVILRNTLTLIHTYRLSMSQHHFKTT